MKNKTAFATRYFEQEGRHNLPQVLNVVKRAFAKREDIRKCKIVIFTARGEGPALAYRKLKTYSPRIIAVTFPPGFTVRRKQEDGSEVEIPVHISDELQKFFKGVDVTVLSGRLPFDGFDGVDSIKQSMKLIRDTLSVFGGGFSLGIQAVLQACDMGAVNIGEKVVFVTGDCSAIVTASSTTHFLSVDSGLAVNEILCKPRILTIVRKSAKQPVQSSGELFPERKEIKLLPPV